MPNQRNISRVLIEAEEKTRNALGAELHDNVNQLLVAARLYIGLEKRTPATHPEYLDRAEEHLCTAIEEIRNLTRKYTTAAVTTEGLENCVLQIAADMFLLKRIRVKVDISAEASNLLSTAQAIMIYRLIQEQTSNIIKYAETKTAEISLRKVEHTIELDISDQGQGFQRTEQKSSGIGFVNMLNRVQAFGGELSITSSPGNGCKVSCQFPL